MKNITGDNMKHEIDLKKYQLRTDLVSETIDNSDNLIGIKQSTSYKEDIKITNVKITGKNLLNKKVGNYVTIEFEDVTDSSNKNLVEKVFIKELKKLLTKEKINKDSSCLVIGLGNSKSTPDSLGPLTIDKVLVTNHLYMLNSLDNGFRRVSALNPGVMGETGMETSDIIKSIIQTVKPDFVIVVDALASGSIDRVNKTIQMTNTGIHPGSGIGNKRKEISKEVLGIPVIAIGVPTVVDAVTIVSDTINYMYKHFSYNKNNKPNKLALGQTNYLKKDVKVEESEKKQLMGLIGNLKDDEVKQLIYEVLTPIGYNLMVTTKEIDFIIEKISDIIGIGINKVLHINYSNTKNG